MSWWNTSWSYKRSVTVDNTAGTAQTNFQVKITLTSSNFTFSHANSDGSDLRVIDADDATVIPHWLESWDQGGQTGTVWVNVPSVPNASSKTIYLYHGNNAIVTSATVGNLQNVFPFGDDFGTRFVKSVSNPVLTVGTALAWDETIVGDPFVILDGSTWHLFYSGFSTTANLTKIGHATSSDGTTWTKDAGNPVLSVGTSGVWDDKFTQKPHVVLVSGTYYLFYSGQKASNSATGLGYATASSLSGPWTKYGSNPIIIADQSYEGTYVDTPSVIYDSGTWKLWYSADTVIAGEPKNWAYATASSPSGTWTKSASNPIATPPGDGSLWSKSLGGLRVSKLPDGTYGNFFNAFDTSDVSRNFYLNSPDGIIWTLANTARLFELGAGGSWEATHVYRSMWLIVSGTEYVFYNAKGTTEQIGLATWTAPSVIDPARWSVGLNSGSSSVSAELFAVSNSNNSSGNATIANSTHHTPAQSLVFDVRGKVTAVNDAAAGQLQWIQFLSSPSLFPSSGTTMQFMFADKADSKTKHQSKNSNTFGSEDQILATPFPATGTFFRTRAIKKSTGIDWYLFDDTGATLGSLVGNTDAPINFSNLPFSFGARGLNTSFDFITVRTFQATDPTQTVGAETPLTSGTSTYYYQLLAGGGSL